MKANYYSTISILALVATLSCSKKSNDSQPTPSTPSQSSPFDLNVTEKSDGSGLWTQSGCALITHKITHTGKSTFDGLTLRYYPDELFPDSKEIHDFTYSCN